MNSSTTGILSVRTVKSASNIVPSIINGKVVLVGLFLSLLSLFFNNGIYLFICFATLLLLANLTWRYGKPGILFFAFFMQWLQVAAYVFWMNTAGFDINKFSSNADTAIMISCSGLLIMAVIVYSMTTRLSIQKEDLQKYASQFNEKRVLILYIISTLFLTSLGYIFGMASAITQVLINISALRWVFFMVYGFIVFANKRSKLIFFVIIIFEFTSSLYSYFSNFKEVLLYSLILTITFIDKINLKHFFLGVLTILVLGGLLLTWSAIKGEYRNFLSKGERQQVVSVERSEAFGKIQDQINNLSLKKYQLAMNVSLYRLQYILNLSLAMDRVPSIIPYQNGQIWGDNISFAIAPRFLFPDKGIYNASGKASKFTGKRYAGLKEGSSFSLGYFADCYVDFGYIGMFIPLTLIALFVSVIYLVFYKMQSLNLFLRFAIINVCLYNFISFESDGLFVFGRLLTTFLVYFALAKTIFPSLQKWLYMKS
jgi:hypothetical protein